MTPSGGNSRKEEWARILEREAWAAENDGADGFIEACLQGAAALRLVGDELPPICTHPDCGGYGTAHPAGHHGFDR